MAKESKPCYECGKPTHSGICTHCYQNIPRFSCPLSQREVVSFLTRLSELDGDLLSVVPASGGIGRFQVLYRYLEDIDIEVNT